MPWKFTVRQTRRLVLVLLAATALVTGGAWFLATQRKAAERQFTPPEVPPNTTQSAGFSLSKSENNRTLFTVKAARAREQKDSGKSILEEVEITTYGAQGNRHDRIYSKLCEYDAKTGRVHSEGEVEIELASLPGEMPVGGAPARPAIAPIPGAPDTPIYVKTSGLTFEEKTGIASTDRALQFRFRRGSGRAVGAIYDSAQRMLRLKSAVEITAATSHRGTEAQSRQNGPQAAPLEIKAAELVYLQREAQVQLQRPEMRRVTSGNAAGNGGGSREIAGERAVLMLDAQNQVTRAEITGSVRARQSEPGAETRLSAGRLELVFGKEQSLERADAIGQVRMDSVGERSRSETQAARVELFFKGADNELAQAQWKGAVRMVIVPAEPAAPTRVLTSEAVEMFMQPGGRDVDAARTLAPGRLELLPGRAKKGEGKRALTAETLWMKFGERSQLRTLTAEKRVRLEQDIPPAEPKPSSGGPTQRVTTSDSLVAQFSAASQELETLEQAGNFRYVEGEQQAGAERAHYRAADERIVLTGSSARNPEVWDAHTRTSARRITLDQKTNEGLAEQQVRTTHLPVEKERDAKAAAVPGPLKANSPVHVAAERMLSNSKTGVTRYEGGAGGRRARLWQNQDVIQALTIVLERQERRLTADGEVTTVLIETGSPESDVKPSAGSGGDGRRESAGSGGAKAPPGVARPITITAGRLVYTDDDRRAHYERSVVLRRQDTAGAAATTDTIIRAATLDAFLLAAAEVKPGQSRLERALARGSVTIEETSATRKRRSGGEVAEYTSADEKVVLSGGEPFILDEQRGYTRGRQLTYHVRDDKIFVHGDRGSRTVTEHRVERRE